MAHLTAAEAAREGAVTGKTHKDQAMVWSRWKKYCGSIGILEDELLDHFRRGQRIRLVGDFAMAVRKGDFQDHLMTPWPNAQSEVTYHLSHRPLGKVTGQNQLRTRVESL